MFLLLYDRFRVETPLSAREVRSRLETLPEAASPGGRDPSEIPPRTSADEGSPLTGSPRQEGSRPSLIATGKNMAGIDLAGASLTITAIRADGTVMDEMTITK